MKKSLVLALAAAAFLAVQGVSEASQTSLGTLLAADEHDHEHDLSTCVNEYVGSVHNAVSHFIVHLNGQQTPGDTSVPSLNESIAQLIAQINNALATLLSCLSL